MLRRLAVVAIALTAGLSVRGQTLPGAPVRPIGAQPPSVAVPSARPVGVVIGQVVDATSGRAVARAAVRLAGRGVTQTRITDEKGRFYFVGVPEADVEITATKIGFFDGAYGKQRAGGTGIPLTMSNGRWITDVRIPLFKAAAISGIVGDEVNEPLAGIRVRAWRREYVEGREQLVPAGDALTDDEGVYRIFDLKPGAYIISVPSVQVTVPFDAIEEGIGSGAPTSALWALLALNRATSAEDRVIQRDGKHVLAVGRNALAPPPERGEALAFQTEFYPGVEMPSQAIPVVVAPSEDRFGVHFQLHLVPAYNVSGVVVGKNGPVANQLVRLVVEGIDDQGFGNETAAALTGSDGAFTMLNVPSGHYVLEARGLAGIVGAGTPHVGVDDTPTLVESPADASGQIDLAIGSADVNNVVVSVNPPPAVTGRVVLESGGPRRTPVDLTRLEVALLPSERTVGAAIARRPDANGTFAFEALAAGSYFARVGSIPQGWSLKSVSNQGVDVLDRPIELVSDAAITITLTDRGTEIWGTARDWRGVPTAGATILVLPPAASGTRGLNPNRLREVRAATSGVYRVDGLPAGDYFVIAIDDAQAEGWQDPARVDALRAQATLVTIRDAEQKLLDLRVVRR